MPGRRALSEVDATNLELSGSREVPRVLGGKVVYDFVIIRFYTVLVV